MNSVATVNVRKGAGYYLAPSKQHQALASCGQPMQANGESVEADIEFDVININLEEACLIVHKDKFGGPFEAELKDFIVVNCDSEHVSDISPRVNTLASLHRKQMQFVTNASSRSIQKIVTKPICLGCETLVKNVCEKGICETCQQALDRTYADVTVHHLSNEGATGKCA